MKRNETRSTRRQSPLDLAIGHFDRALRTVSGNVGTTRRPSPGKGSPAPTLTAEERDQAARLMRVNHCGEVCAQALYNGQALTAKSSRTAGTLKEAAAEETDHLSWCETRLEELGSHVSYLNPAWYAASFAMGAAAGLMGDKINLGFVAATEEQVCQHLDEHLEKLPEADVRSRQILEQMRTDESGHQQSALQHGGAIFPKPVKRFMTAVSRTMTATTYWV